MRTSIFDRHEFIKSAMLTGMPEQQAEVIASYVQEVHKMEGGSFATKQDILQFKQEFKQEIHRLDQKIDSVKTDLEHKIDSVKGGLEHKIGACKVEVLRWYVGVALFQTTAMIGAIVALVKMLH